MRKKLTEAVVKQKAEEEVWDTLLPGFGLRIGKRRRTYFVMARVDGRQVRRTVGTTIELSLTEARNRARTMLADFAKGVDPVEAERRDRLKAARQRRTTFAGVSADYMAEQGCMRKDAEELQRKLDVELLPLLGHLPITAIRRADVKALILDKAAVAPRQADQLKGLLRLVFNYAIDEELGVEANPVTRIKVPINPPRERVLSDAEIVRFWNGLQFLNVAPVDRILKVLLLTGQRRNEVAHLKWSELDLEEGRWELPASRAKSGRTHALPLSRLALDLMGEPDGHEYVFHRRDGSPIPGNTVTHVVWRYRQTFDLGDAVVHDLRRTFASGLARLGIDRLVISQLLGHSEGGVTKIYDRWDRWEPKKIAMESWSEHLKAVITGRPAPSNVRHLERIG